MSQKTEGPLNTETAGAEPKPLHSGNEELQECVSKKIPILLKEGYEEKQAQAIAFSMCRKKLGMTETKKCNICGLEKAERDPTFEALINVRNATKAAESVFGRNNARLVGMWSNYERDAKILMRNLENQNRNKNLFGNVDLIDPSLFRNVDFLLAKFEALITVSSKVEEFLEKLTNYYNNQITVTA